MSNFYQKLQILETGKIPEMTLKDCQLLLRHFPDFSADLIKKLSISRSKCYICRLRSYEKEVQFRDDLRKVCGGCYLDIYYGIFDNVKSVRSNW